MSYTPADELTLLRQANDTLRHLLEVALTLCACAGAGCDRCWPIRHQMVYPGAPVSVNRALEPAQ